MPIVTRSNSQKSSDNRDKNRTVSFNKDVHVKRIVPVKKSRPLIRASSVAGNNSFITLPVRKNITSAQKESTNNKRPEETINATLTDDNNSITNSKDRNRFHTLPSRLDRKKPGSNSNGLRDQRNTSNVNGNNEKQSSPSITDYLRNFIAEIDSGLSSNPNTQENLPTNSHEDEKNMSNFLTDNSTKKLNSNTNSNPIIYAQVVCNKREPSMKKENVHMSATGATLASSASTTKLLTSSDSDEGVSGCRRSSPSSASFVTKPPAPSSPVTKTYTRFGDDTSRQRQDIATKITPTVLVQPEQRIEPKMRHYEPKRFFDFDHGTDNENNQQKHSQIDFQSPIKNRGQADGMDEQRHFVDNSDSSHRKKMFVSNSLHRRFRNHNKPDDYGSVENDDDDDCNDGDDDNNDINDEYKNDLLTVQNLRKRNELSERRNLLESRLKYRLSNQRFPISANKKQNDQEQRKEEQSTNHSTSSVAEMSINESVNPYVEKYVRESNRFYNKPMKQSQTQQLNHYKSNPELFRYYDNRNSAEINAELPTVEIQNQKEFQYEKENQQRDATSYKRNRSRNHIRIVQTKSLQNLMRQKKFANGDNEESEDEGFASGQQQSQPQQLKHSSNYRPQEHNQPHHNRDDWNRMSESSPSSFVSANDSKPKVSGFQRVKQLFWKRRPQQEIGNIQNRNQHKLITSSHPPSSGNQNRLTIPNGKFVEIYRCSPDTDQFLDQNSQCSTSRSIPLHHSNSNDPYYEQNGYNSIVNEHKRRSKFSHASNNNRSWFKSLDRLTTRDKENKDRQQLHQQQFLPTKDSNESRPKKNLRFFGDSDFETIGKRSDTTAARQINSSNGGKLKISRYRSNDSNSALSSQLNPQNYRYKSQSYVDLTKDVDCDNDVIDENNVDGDKGLFCHGNLKSTKNGGFYESKTLDSKSTKKYNRSMYNLDRRSNKNSGKYNYTVDDDDDEIDVDEDDDSFYEQQISVRDMPQRKAKAMISGNRRQNAAQLTSYSNNLPANQTVYIQPTRIKSVSRSFSLLAPWRPKHREKSVIDYPQSITIPSPPGHHLQMHHRP